MRKIYTLFVLIFILSNLFAWEGTGSEADPYLISTPENLVELSESTESHEGEYFKMTSDIDMISIGSFKAIGTSGSVFKGNFDGQDFKIKNLIVTTGGFENSYVALFGNVEGGTIKNIHITGASFFEGKKHVAAVIGYIRNGIVNGCSSTAFVKGNNEYSEYIAGIVGESFGSTITKCSNYGEIIAEGENSSNIAGVAGQVYNGGSISECFNLGNVTGSSYVAGVCGLVGNDESITDCYNKGIIIGTKEYIGGVAGSVQTGLLTNGEMHKCYNTGKIKGAKYVGGVVGSTAITTNSCNIGTVEASGEFAGGIAGSGSVSSSYNTASVKGKKAVGGVAGNVKTIANCYNSGNIKGEENVGGLAGEITGETANTIFHSYNRGNVTIEGTNTNIGGIAGYIKTGGLVNSNEVKNSYWNKDVYSGKGVGNLEDPAVGATGNFLYYGKTSIELKNNFYSILGNTWIDDTQNINDGYPVLSGDISTLNVEASPIFTITVSSIGNGTVTNIGTTETVEGSALLYFITPDQGWIIDKITVDGVNKGSSAVFNLENVSGNHNVSVIFKDPSNIGIDSHIENNISYYFTTDELFIENIMDSHINIFDITGKQILSRKINNENECINISNLQNGVYIINIQKNNKHTSFKIVK